MSDILLFLPPGMTKLHYIEDCESEDRSDTADAVLIAFTILQTNYTL